MSPAKQAASKSIQAARKVGCRIMHSSSARGVHAAGRWWWWSWGKASWSRSCGWMQVECPRARLDSTNRRGPKRVKRTGLVRVDVVKRACVYNKSIKLLRLRILRVFTAGLGPSSSGHGGSSRVGSRSSAPRATMRFRGDASAAVELELEVDAGMGGIVSGEGPRAPCAVPGREVEPSGAIRELRLSLLAGALA